ncbi:MAG: methylated-DNA--[protein]-cysteine S-methyltransferase [Planctomycetaceae bacterium]
MGQRAGLLRRSPRVGKRPADDARVAQLTIFRTDLGWFGLWGNGENVAALSIGHESPDEVRRACPLPSDNEHDTARVEECDWHPALRRRLEQFACGIAVDFADVEVSLPSLSVFQQRVVEETRRIGYGETVTYGVLAERAGYPGAARAVGSVMSANRLPIIIPCHRVIAAGGRLGGFSAPSGISLKQTMLDLEARVR